MTRTAPARVGRADAPTRPAGLTARFRTAAAVLVTAAVLAAGATVPAVPASADDLDDKRAQTEARQNAVDQAIAALEAELEHTDAALVEAYAELKGIEAQIPVAQAQLDAAEALLVKLEREAAILADRLTAARTLEEQITAQIAEDEAQTDRITAAIGRMAREAYRGDLTATSLSAVLDARSTDEFIEQSAMASTALRTQTQALRELEQVNGANRNRQVRLVAVREEIAELKAEADAKVAEAEVARAEAQQRRDELDRLRAEQQAKTAEIERQRDAQLAKQAELEAQQAQLEADLREIVRLQEEQRKKEAAAAAAAGGSGTPPQGSTADRPFINPSSVSPMHVTSDYGMRLHPILGYWRLHAGTDIRTWCGTPVYAGASGEVQWARFRGGYGNQVMLNHGYWKGKSLMSSYNHLSSFATSAGTWVSQGQLIGYAGSTGTSAACHLHFEVYLNGATTDPRPMINA